MKRSLLHRIALGAAVGVMALGGVACEMEEGGDNLEPGLEEGGEDLGGEVGGEGGDL